ncbi:transposase, partial [Streptomyces antimycoticus]|uniref:transposase n=1 Tax=Streptomyces antimycoticus TaxID=68175 RepID=UPI00191B9FD5
MHRAHAAVEQVFADLEDSALGHLPSGKFTANAAWLTLAATAYNLTRAAGHLASAFHAKARTGTIRRHLIAVPARIARPGRQVALHLPQRWRWADDFADLWTATGPAHADLTAGPRRPPTTWNTSENPPPERHPETPAARNRKPTPKAITSRDQRSRDGSRLRRPQSTTARLSIPLPKPFVVSAPP